MLPPQNLISLPYLNKSSHFSSIILASNSPRRKKLLEKIGITFEIIPSSVDEDFSVDLSPVDFAKHYAEKKANFISSKYPRSLVIGADTIVVCNNSILGKPLDNEDAFSMLEKLSGNTHTVITGVSLQLYINSISKTFYSKTDVTVKNLSREEIQYYIENYKPLDKAGSYGIQEWFSVYVEKIEGCYFNVMGLPLSKLYKEMGNIIIG